LKAAASARNALAPRDHPCSAACSQINWRAWPANLRDGNLAADVSREVAVLQVVLSALQYPNRRAYQTSSFIGGAWRKGGMGVEGFAFSAWDITRHVQ
jgi:hypothetical protein